jgi:hypothetical protein
MNNINILFDSKVLIDAYFTANSSRSGVYFVAWNVLQEMQKKTKLLYYAYLSGRV